MHTTIISYYLEFYNSTLIVCISVKVNLSNFGSSCIYCFSTAPESCDSPIEYII